MSMDGVDDLHAAEEFAAMAVETLKRFAGGAYPYREAAVVISAWLNYCRPTCNPLDEGPHDEVCQEGATCGCPCRALAPPDPLPEP